MSRARKNSTRFSSGCIPWNKGLTGYAPEGSESTRFQLGRHSHRWVPIGTEKVNGYGYLERKVTESEDRRIAWQPVHKLNWESVNGPVPRGHILVFRDGNKSNVDMANLELVTRTELMQRNTMHRLPDDLRDVIHLKSRLTRKINEHDR